MRQTKQKAMIMNYFVEFPDTHPTAEQVYDHLKKKNPKLGLATVYRNLNLLVAKDIIASIPLSKSGARYDAKEIEHYHLICENCGKIENIYIKQMEDIKSDIQKQTTSIILNQEILFRGICQECQNKKNEQH